ncbi:MAG: D-cysteine desulfhydrase family protein [Candidatus Thiodiazotropha lotti]|uniref:D-cysteine desulfhydrase family protein n=1 Tax=Candidatus Thiodiazotropha lotti TaxID=2792787 RepID=A0A9E4N1M0_9GAMM|nr:D-cysteine desulfhydrase family protein [Candidatus Thiodiazotropha lotti]MCG7939950.1 D-cysteine desulfhydrase family protein [Candidatus Thiodiazotropha lotti]MCW4204423.1 D-cysteine desulfhydrase family protein [Candidatus Thiodiazotropha lotti]MCW4222692.1 D-cysteine desulfhydrase family protein [Candidatus Thiodiazotropha lotti]
MSITSPSKVNLGLFPTPITKLSRLSSLLNGPEIFMKRDDLSGLALGGNKTRKLEYLFYDAISKGCDTVVTAGAAQSNHCRHTAAAAALLHKGCHLVLGGEPPDIADGNLLLDKLFGSRVHWRGAHRKGEDIPEIVEALKREGSQPYMIPYGGSNEIGAYGFVHAMAELEMQLDTSAITHIVFASSSGGTHAGMMLGRVLLHKAYRLIGINIDKGENNTIPFDDFIIDLANRTSLSINSNHRFTTQDLILNGDYVGEGYGVIGELEREAISLMAENEAILLDPVYTGRAMGGLIDMIRGGEFSKTDKVLFWHTGGIPALFAYADSL